MARIAHPYKFRAFRTLGFLLYLESPCVRRHLDGTLELTSISEFAMRTHMANNQYVREDLRALLKLGLLESLDLGHNRGVLKIKPPVGMTYEQ